MYVFILKFIRHLFHKAFSDTRKAVKKRISIVRSNPQESCDEIEEADKGKILIY